MNTHPEGCTSQAGFPEHGGRHPLEEDALPGTEECIDFSASINPLGPPEPVQKILLEAGSLVTKYPDPACSELKQALSGYLNIPQSRLVTGNGACELIYLLPRFLKSGAEALLLAPLFSEYKKAFNLFRVPVRSMLYDALREFEPPVEKLIQYLNRASRIGAVVIGHPNSPTGRLWNPGDFGQLVRICERRGILLIVDESFIDFCDPSCSFLNEYGEHPHVIFIRSMTKFFAFPGLRLGYGIMDESWVRILERFQPPWSINALAQAAGIASFQDKAFFQKTRDHVRRERHTLIRHLSNMPGVRVHPSDANFILFRIEDKPLWFGIEMYFRLLKEGVLLRNCGNFDGLDPSYFRIAIRTADENRLLIEKLEACLGHAA